MSISRRSVLLAALALAAPAVEANAAVAKGDTQPLWLIQRGGARVFLYGNGGSVTPAWSAPRVEAAFAESAVFWKETPEQSPADRPLFARAGVDPKRPLSSWLTPEERAVVTAAAERAGTTYAAIEPLKPWLAALSLSEGFGRTSTRPKLEDPLPVLTARAKASGKTIRTEFPDTASQLTMMTGMSDRAQVEFLLYTIENSTLPQEAVDRRRAAWAAGDLRLETAQVAHLKKDFSSLFGPIELDRNRRWPDRFKSMLEGGGTTFVIVGADHLVGPDSLLVFLKRAGMRPKRV
jgi:uncharacterized protein YbaP (TraB family)